MLKKKKTYSNVDLLTFLRELRDIVQEYPKISPFKVVALLQKSKSMPFFCEQALGVELFKKLDFMVNQIIVNKV
jgi:hypothetical protein